MHCAAVPLCRALCRSLKQPVNMSKKNKKSTRRNLHAFDIEREKAATEKLKKEQEKKTVALTSKGIEKPKKKNKKLRLRKGVHVKVGF